MTRPSHIPTPARAPHLLHPGAGAGRRPVPAAARDRATGASPSSVTPRARAAGSTRPTGSPALAVHDRVPRSVLPLSWGCLRRGRWRQPAHMAAMSVRADLPTQATQSEGILACWPEQPMPGQRSGELRLQVVSPLLVFPFAPWRAGGAGHRVASAPTALLGSAHGRREIANGQEHGYRIGPARRPR